MMCLNEDDVNCLKYIPLEGRIHTYPTAIGEYIDSIPYFKSLPITGGGLEEECIRRKYKKAYSRISYSQQAKILNAQHILVMPVHVTQISEIELMNEDENLTYLGQGSIGVRTVYLFKVSG